MLVSGDGRESDEPRDGTHQVLSAHARHLARRSGLLLELADGLLLRRLGVEPRLFPRRERLGRDGRQVATELVALRNGAGVR